MKEEKISVKNINYIIAAFFIISWAIGFVVYDSEYLVHFLLILGLVSIMVRVIPPKSEY